MKPYFFHLLLCCCCFWPALLKAQDTLTAAQQFALVKTARREAIKTHSLKGLEALIASGKLTTPEARADAYGAKGAAAGKMHRMYLKKKTETELPTESIFVGILNDFDAAIQACERCAIFHKRDRYKVLQDFAPKSPLTAIHLPELRAAGFRPEKNGVGLALNVWQGHHTWLGISFSPASRVQRPYHFRHITPKGTAGSLFVAPIAMSAASFSYARNLHQPVHDVSFSLVQINAPIVLNITTFGFQVGKDAEGKRVERGPYYRPEVGVGFGHFSVSYAYNLMFKKTARSISEKHLLQARYLHVFDSGK